MRKKWRMAGLFLLPLFFCVILTGCNTTTAAATTEETAEDEIEHYEGNTEMVVAVNVDKTYTELPFDNVWMNRSEFWGSLIFQGLLMAENNINNVQPDLCEEYAVSPDGLSYVFILRENLYWHDGQKITADDVVWSIETCLKIQESNGFVKNGLQNILGAEEYGNGTADSISGIQVDDRNITIKITQQNNSFLAAIAQLAIVPKHYFEDVEPEEISTSDFWKNPVGSGPYKVAAVNEDHTEAILVVNEDYSGKAPKIQQIRYTVLENPDEDYFDFTITSDPVTISKFHNKNGYKAIQTNNLYYRYLVFNLDGRDGENEGLLQNQKIRQALMYALDRESLIENLYEGAAVVMDSGIPSYDAWYVEAGKDTPKYDPKLAKQMLEEAGFDFNKTLILTRYNTDELSVKMLEEIAGYWNRIGVKTEIIPIKSDATNALFVEADWYDIALKNLSAVDYDEWYQEYSSDNQLWSVVWENRKDFDSWIESIHNSKWAYEKSFVYSKIQKQERDLVFKIPLAIVPRYIIYNSEQLQIPEMEIPNLWYYFDLNLSRWSLLE